MKIGYFLSSEEFGPRELVRQARIAEQAGFTDLWISDHFHPWNGIGDGFALAAPDAESIGRFRSAGGGDKPVQAGTKVCWGADEAACRRTAHATWPNEGLPGELAQVLPDPAHFEQASTLVTEDMIAESVACGPDVGRHVAQLQAYADAGVDHVFVQQIGPEQDGFFEAYARDVLPRFAA